MRNIAAALALLALSSTAFADGPAPARIRIVVGEVSLQRATEASAEPAVANLIWLAGDRLWTEPGGRAELQLPDGSLLHLATASKLDLIGLDPEGGDGVALRLWAGSLSLWIPPGRERPDVAVETPDALVSVREPGLYRIDAITGETRLSVVQGAASLESAGERLSLRPGERSWARYGEAPERPGYFDEGESDAFDAWVDERLRVSRHALPAGIPSEVEPWAGELSEYGDWADVPEVGTVWRPTRVAVDWQPYSYGHWAWSPWGWSWTSDEPWGWAPYHYGRWGYSASLGWYWSPGRDWGPAWVSWSLGSGYVGWCPLGLRGGPVFPHYRYGHGNRGWLYVDHRGLGSRRLGPHRVGYDRLRGASLAHLDLGYQPDRGGRHAVARSAERRTVRGGSFGQLDDRYRNRSAARPETRSGGRAGDRSATRGRGVDPRAAARDRGRAEPQAERTRGRTPSRTGSVSSGRDPGTAARGVDRSRARDRVPAGADPRPSARPDTRSRSATPPATRTRSRERSGASDTRPAQTQSRARSSSRESSRGRSSAGSLSPTSRSRSGDPSRAGSVSPNSRSRSSDRSRAGGVSPNSRSRSSDRSRAGGVSPNSRSRSSDRSRAGGVSPSSRSRSSDRSRSGSVSPASRSRSSDRTGSATRTRPAASSRAPRVTPRPASRSRDAERPAARERGAGSRGGPATRRDRPSQRPRERQQQP